MIPPLAMALLGVVLLLLWVALVVTGAVLIMSAPSRPERFIAAALVVPTVIAIGILAVLMMFT